MMNCNAIPLPCKGKPFWLLSLKSVVLKYNYSAMFSIILQLLEILSF